MFIKQLQIYNLKGTQERTIDFKLKTKVSGRNGTGKTTIKDAITFLLYGRINGSNQIDGAINKDANYCKIVGHISFNNNEYVIERTKGNKSSIKVNGKFQQQVFLDEVFGEFDLFSSAVCIGDFMKFNDTDKRQMLLSITKPVDKYELYKQLTGHTSKFDLHHRDHHDREDSAQVLETRQN